jgi:hypothetical protein
MGTCSLDVLPQPQLKASVRQCCALLDLREVKAKLCSHAIQTSSIHTAVGLIRQFTQRMENFTVKTGKTFPLKTKRKQTRGFSPQANYTDRETAACRRS